MEISIFKSVSSKAQLCTLDIFKKTVTSQEIKDICNHIKNLEQLPEDAPIFQQTKKSEMISQNKKRLPLITWQSNFPNGRRISSQAIPSGLFMLDIDHVENPYKLYQEKIENKIADLMIVAVHITPSTHGLRIVAQCDPLHSTLEDMQKFLAERLQVEYDGVCKDWARASFLVPYSYFLYFDEQLFNVERVPLCIYKVQTDNTPADTSVKTSQVSFTGSTQSSGLYKNIPIKEICRQWYKENGGEPKEGERNAKIFKLATRLRYICDFNADTLLANLESYGLPENEMKQIISSALSSARRTEIPTDIENVVKKLSKINEIGVDIENLDNDILGQNNKVPYLPPIFKQWYDAAPDDFKIPAILCQLPILATLGSKLRAKYIDGVMHSPTFQVSLEAPQASGKSFIRRIVDYDLQLIKEHDEQQRVKEREYNERVKEIKLLNTKITKKNQEEILGQKPQTLIRYVPPTMSITMLLQRMSNAQGLHLFAMAEEIDTVYKAFKKGFSSYSDALRCSFDNAEYGQDFASENSFSGIVKLYYNVLFSGTPKAMRRFYPDIEDGLVSRVLFVNLPDQFGKPMPVWRNFTKEEEKIVQMGLMKLNEITIQGDKVQSDYQMQMDFLNKKMQSWVLKQQAYAVKINDRTRDIFCRRAAVVGFRAGMLAWFLYDENNHSTIKKHVNDFAIWVAEMMLQQHLVRFTITEDNKNIVPYKEIYDELNNTFNEDDLITVLNSRGYQTRTAQVIYKWFVANMIKKLDKKNKIYEKII